MLISLEITDSFAGEGIVILSDKPKIGRPHPIFIPATDQIMAANYTVPSRHTTAN